MLSLYLFNPLPVLSCVYNPISNTALLFRHETLNNYSAVWRGELSRHQHSYCMNIEQSTLQSRPHGLINIRVHSCWTSKTVIKCFHYVLKEKCRKTMKAGISRELKLLKTKTTVIIHYRFKIKESDMLHVRYAINKNAI